MNTITLNNGVKMPQMGHPRVGAQPLLLSLCSKDGGAIHAVGKGIVIKGNVFYRHLCAENGSTQR